MVSIRDRVDSSRRARFHARTVVLALVVIGFSAVADAGFRGPSGQLPPTGRVPRICNGQGYAALAVDRETVGIGESVVVTIDGEPFAPVALLADVGMGPVTLPTVGTFCLDFGADLTVIVDGIRGGNASIDEQGIFTYSLRIPHRARLRGLSSFFIQAVIETDDAPNGIAITNMTQIDIEP